MSFNFKLNPNLEQFIIKKEGSQIGNEKTVIETMVDEVNRAAYNITYKPKPSITTTVENCRIRFAPDLSTFSVLTNIGEEIYELQDVNLSQFDAFNMQIVNTQWLKKDEGSIIRNILMHETDVSYEFNVNAFYEFKNSVGPTDPLIMFLYGDEEDVFSQTYVIATVTCMADRLSMRPVPGYSVFDYSPINLLTNETRTSEAILDLKKEDNLLIPKLLKILPLVPTNLDYDVIPREKQESFAGYHQLVCPMMDE